jgi:hypothetical protein
MELRFDAGKLAIDVLRKRQGKPYHEVGIEVGIAPSTIYRAESRLPLSLKSFTHDLFLAARVSRKLL